MWEGWFDLHVATRTMHGIWQPQVFDCHVSEDGKHIKDLGAGIGGKIVNVVGRLVQFPEENAVDCYVQVSRLTVVGDAGDELKVPDSPKTEKDLKIEKGVLSDEWGGGMKSSSILGSGGSRAITTTIR